MRPSSHRASWLTLTYNINGVMKINLAVGWTVVTVPGTHALLADTVWPISLRKIVGVILVDIKIVKLNQYYDKLNLL